MKKNKESIKSFKMFTNCITSGIHIYKLNLFTYMYIINFSYSFNYINSINVLIFQNLPSLN